VRARIGAQADSTTTERTTCLMKITDPPVHVLNQAAAAEATPNAKSLAMVESRKSVPVTPVQTKVLVQLLRHINNLTYVVYDELIACVAKIAAAARERTSASEGSLNAGLLVIVIVRHRGGRDRRHGRGQGLRPV
jgi:hypothetical protein